MRSFSLQNALLTKTTVAVGKDEIRVLSLRAKGEEIASLVTNRMMIKNAPLGDSFKNAGGLAIYLPTSGFDANYSKLALSKAGKWDEFMQWLNN